MGPIPLDRIGNPDAEGVDDKPPNTMQNPVSFFETFSGPVESVFAPRERRHPIPHISAGALTPEAMCKPRNKTLENNLRNLESWTSEAVCKLVMKCIADVVKCLPSDLFSASGVNRHVDFARRPIDTLERVCQQNDVACVYSTYRNHSPGNPHAIVSILCLNLADSTVYRACESASDTKASRELCALAALNDLYPLFGRKTYDAQMKQILSMPTNFLKDAHCMVVDRLEALSCGGLLSEMDIHETIRDAMATELAVRVHYDSRDESKNGSFNPYGNGQTAAAIIIPPGGGKSTLSKENGRLVDLDELLKLDPAKKEAIRLARIEAMRDDNWKAVNTAFSELISEQHPKFPATILLAHSASQLPANYEVLASYALSPEDAAVVAAERKLLSEQGIGTPLGYTLVEPAHVKAILKGAEVVRHEDLAANVSAVIGEYDARDEVKTGSFNPYGNGQGAGKKRTAQHVYNGRLETVSVDPFSGFDENCFPDELDKAVRSLNRGARGWALDVTGLEAYHGVFEGYSPDDILGRADEDIKPPSALRADKADKKVFTGSPLTQAAKATSERHEDKKLSAFSWERKKNVIAQRVAGRVKSWDDVVDYLYGSDSPIPADLAKAVVDQCRRKGVKESDDSKAVALAIAAEVPAREVIQQLSYWSKPLRALIAHPKSIFLIDRLISGQTPRVLGSSWGEEIMRGDSTQPSHDRPDPDMSGKPKTGSFNAYGNEQIAQLCLQDDSAWSAVLARNRNQVMHAMNGNATTWSFPNGMDDLKSAVSLGKLFEEGGDVRGPHADPIDDVAVITGLLGIQGVTMSSVPREMALRGSTQNNANVVDLLNDLNHPESLLYPTRPRSLFPSGPPVAPTFRPPLFGVGSIRRKALYPAVASAEGTAMLETIARAANIRSDQLSNLGFKTSDIAALMRLESDLNGDTICEMLLKARLYCMSLSWKQSSTLLPLGSEPSKLDSFSIIGAFAEPVLGYNNAVLSWNANCSGPGAPVFPFLAPGNNPRIAFHVCKASIPSEDPWFMIPPGLLLQNDRGDNSINIALLAMLLAPYPCGIHTVLLPTAGVDGTNAAPTLYIPHSALTHVGGISTTIHIYLPSKEPARNPSIVGDAERLATLIPITGPTAYGGLGANAPLAFSFAGVGGLVTHSLAAYLGSWMAQPNSPVDITTVTRFMKQIASLTKRAEDLPFSYELANCLAVRYPAMGEYLPNTAGVSPTLLIPTVNLRATALQNFFALEPHRMTADFPQLQDAYDFYVPSMNGNWWNKIMSGAYISTCDKAAYPPINRVYDASARLLQYAILSVRKYATTSQCAFTYMQQGVGIWNAAFSTTNYVGIMRELRDFFVTAAASSTGMELIAPLGHQLAVLHSRLTGCSPAADMTGHTVWDYINAPRVGFQTITGINPTFNRLSTPLPSVLPDVWVQMTMSQNTRATTPLLSPVKRLTGLPVENGSVMPLGAGSYSMPFPYATQGREVGLETIPEFVDNVCFNQRLIWHTFQSSLFTLDGIPYLTSTVTPGNVVCQRYCAPDYTNVDQLNPGILTADTRWMPFMTQNGERVVVGVSAANGAQLMTRVISGASYGGVETWLIRSAVGMPLTIVDGGGTNQRSRLPRRQTAENALPSSTAASGAGDAVQTSI